MYSLNPMGLRSKVMGNWSLLCLLQDLKIIH
jgi:hypothetical protein